MTRWPNWRIAVVFVAAVLFVCIALGTTLVLVSSHNRAADRHERCVSDGYNPFNAECR